MNHGLTRALAIAAGLLLGTAATTATAQDFGDFLRQAARDTLERSIAPERIAENLVRPILQPRAAETYTVKTGDDWTLVAHRYRPAGPGRPGMMPVILCHGLTYNAEFWDLDPTVSLAQYLAQRGFDVWAVDLRGCGKSQKWVFRLEAAPDVLIGGALRRATQGKLAPTGYASIDPRFADWNLDDHITYDVLAFVKLVQHHTRAPQVAWVGHSMGGIVALAHLSRFPNPGIGRMITVGSQVTMQDAQLILPFFQEMLRTRQRQLTGELTGEALIEQTRTSVHNLFFNINHVSPKVYQMLASEATDIPAMGLLKQYMTLSSRGELWDARKQFNYARALGNVKVPILIAAGSSDRFAPPAVQKYLYQHVGSTDKRLLLIGRAAGFAVDAGHDDALVGLTSQQQVYPLIERWLLGQRF